MAHVTKTVLVEFSSSQMFELVDRVEDYPIFLPWCGGTELIRRDLLTTVATIRIDFMGVKQSFTTENQKAPPHEMQINLREGPFTQMNGQWRFKPLGIGACKIDFELKYSFSSSLLDAVLSPVFSHIANTFVDAFVHRAEEVYTNNE
ncbi:MAG: type II toxin-antitoxin system RatA family toxin [Thiobacillaceae bacterium]